MHECLPGPEVHSTTSDYRKALNDTSHGTAPCTVQSSVRSVKQGSRGVRAGTVSVFVPRFEEEGESGSEQIVPAPVWLRTAALIGDQCVMECSG